MRAAAIGNVRDESDGRASPAVSAHTPTFGFPVSEALRSRIQAVFAGETVEVKSASDAYTGLLTVERDVARCHALHCGRFDCALRGGGAAIGQKPAVQVVFVKEGGLDVRQWGRVTPLQAGDIFVCCGWLPLSLHVEDRLQALIFDLPAWWAINRFMDGTVVTPDLRISHDYFAARAIHNLAEAVFDGGGDPAAGAQGLEMLAGVLRTALSAHVNERNTLPRVAGRMGRILQFMIQHIDQPSLSAQDAAAALKCSARTIYKACADEGATFNAILMDLKLLIAQDRLLRTEDQVAQIAYAVGFTSLSHFSRVFKARFGVPPKTYRRMEAALGAADAVRH